MSLDDCSQVRQLMAEERFQPRTMDSKVSALSSTLAASGFLAGP